MTGPSDRFWTKVEKTDTCWLWLGYKNEAGYGTFNSTGRARKAHRVAYEALVGPIPEGLVIDHLCRNRGCVNPEHMEPVTQVVNAQRGVHVPVAACRNGHPYDEANSYTPPGGWRSCRACARAAQRRYMARKAARA